jgi:thioredoxin-like negative regulator of GroEL
MTQITVLVAVLALATVVGLAFRARAGKVRNTASSGDTDTAELLASVGVQSAVPTVLHFSADWCGPCAAVRRVVGQVIADLSRSAHPPVEVEVDIDEHPLLAKKLGVMSLPTTFIFDGGAIERFRISGVPTSADLRTALLQLSS